MATDKIALTSSMRSNLLSLKNTQSLLDKTQDRLSTGYKVNSAMDNPSSYFTAQSLNSRADDLSTLLDSIGQAISTLEVADEGITTLQEFVEQAKSIANSARDTANVASSAVSENVTFNSATAKTDKLSSYLNNISAGDSFTIRLGDATTMEATSNVSKELTLEEAGLVEGMSMEMIVGDKTYNFTLVAGETQEAVENADGTTSQQIGIASSMEEFMNDVVYTVGRKTITAEIKEGKLSFSTLDNSSMTIRSTNEAIIGTANSMKIEKADLTLAALAGTGQGATGEGFVVAPSVTIDGLQLDLSEYFTSTKGQVAFAAGVDSEDIINAIKTFAEQNGYSASIEDGTGDLTIFKNEVGATAPVIAFAAAQPTGGTAATPPTATDGGAQDITATFNDILGFDNGYSVTITEGMTVEEFRQAVDNLEGISADFDSKGHLVISGEQGDDMVIADITGGNNNVIRSLLGSDIYSATNGSNERAKYAEQFDAVLDQIDQLVQDTSYKGINLLNGDDLTVVFNESRTSTLELKGVTFNSTGLGFTTSEAEWKDNANIDKSLDQITKATSLLRAQASEFGQNLSTVQIREDFTENMINNLQTGADKLTLADMNEEAANMLALQTRQQLGINSLSMASQAAQSVLQLF